MVRVWMAAAAAAAMLLAASRAEAQSASTLGTGAPTLQAASLSPRLALHPASVEIVPAAPLRAAGGGLDNGEKLMIIGGAAFIAGAIIGNTAGTIIMIGGAGVGLYGLYIHLGKPKGMADEIGLSRTF